MELEQLEEASNPVSVGRSYTRGRRVPYLIRKWPGSNWALPLGPYTVTQLVILVGSVYVLITTAGLWAHLGPGNLLVGVGIPIALTYAARYTRVEGRDPLRAAAAGFRYLLQPRKGYLGGQAWQPVEPVRRRSGMFAVAHLKAPASRPADARHPHRPPRGSMAELVAAATKTQGN
jgi:hypothetical protein